MLHFKYTAFCLIVFVCPYANKLFAWNGDTDKFKIDNLELSLNAPGESGIAYISEESSYNYNATWECTLSFDFTPSSANYVKWYLISDQEDLTSSLNGYFLRIGYTDKNICLYRQNGQSNIKLAEGQAGRLSTPKSKIELRILRDVKGLWTVRSRLSDESNFIDEFETIDNTHERCKYHGFVCVYTSTRSKGFHFTSLYASGNEYIDILPPKPLEIVFNEILFRPFDDGSDFVELYNNSGNILQLSSVKIANRKKEIMLPSYKLYPNAYVVLCSNKDAVCAFYQCKSDTLFVETDLPSMPNDSGYLALLSEDGLVLDSLLYESSMHQALVINNKGVSLERINQNSSSWTSASYSVGYATPGYKNSQFTDFDYANPDTIEWTSSELFSPDNDGNNDVLYVYYKTKVGTYANVWVYHSSGYPVKQLCKNELLSSSGTILWDGRNESGKLCSIGIYVICIDIYSEDGISAKKKIPIVLSAKR